MLLQEKLRSTFDVLSGAGGPLAGSLRAFILRGAAGNLLLKLTGTALALAGSILLARLLAAEGYGLYAYTLAWINLLCIPAELGMNKLVLRQVAVYHSGRDWGRLRGLLRWSNALALGLSATLALILASAALWRPEAVWARCLAVAAPLLPLLTLTALRQAALQGLHHVVLAQAPEFVMRPALLLGLLTLALLAAVPLAAPGALALNLLAAMLAFAQGWWLLRRRLPPELAATAPHYQAREWLRSALPLAALAGLQALGARLDLLLLGLLRPPGEVGIYAVALRCAELLGFCLSAVNAVMAPTIARLYAEKRLPRLQQVVTKTSRLLCAICLPLGILLVLLSEPLLGLFGPEFRQGRVVLALLVAGQVVNTVLGSVGLLLTMTGHERDAVKGMALSVLLNVLLCPLLILILGLQGAALANTLSLILWNLIYAVWVRRRLGIRPGPLGGGADG